MKSPLPFPLIILSLLLLLLFLPLQIPLSYAQLSPSEKRILLQLKSLLEHPQVLQQWDNATDFCSLRHPSSLVVACSGNHVTELVIVGDPGVKSPSPALSREFSTDSLFTVLTKLSSLRRLSLVGLGLRGGLSGKISRFSGLESLNASSNRLQGSIPQSIGKLKRLKSLVLRDNLLNGSVPDLKGMSQLEELDLGGNYLGPNFPPLGKNLSKIVLSNNSIRSPVPEQMLKKMNSLRILDLYSNHLVGPVPPSLFSLPALEHMNLARNQLSGEIPATVSCSGTLKFVDISNNLLVGELPGCLLQAPRTVPAEADRLTVISLWNCLGNGSSKYQHRLSFCAKQAIAVDPKKKKGEMGEPATVKLGVVVGVIVAVVAVVSGVGLLGIGVYKKVRGRKRDDDEQYDRRSSSFAFDVNSTRHLDGRGNSRRPMRMVSMGLPPYNVFTPEEMEEATNHFHPSNLVGVGSSHQVYRGKLKDGSVVLVNCQTVLIKQQKHYYSLEQHIDAISRLRHRHLMSVIGHSIVAPSQDPHSPTTLFLVLEPVPGASLQDHLADWRKRDVLKWPQRMGMAMGIAKGIQYLHAGGVTGNHIKLENVLLDDTLTPRLFNYNISLPSKIVSESPPNAQDQNISARVGEEDDIYQLGVILIEVIIGRPITSQAEVQDLKLQVETCLAESPGKLRDLTDPCIRGTFAYESLKTTVQIALNCLSEERSKRPSIEDVLWHLQYSFQVQEGWGSSGNLSGSLSGNLVKKLSGNLGAKLY
ncbi:unnamed protein product [Cuscuta campestris]|uniref:Protein kinase domain-containing protein n=1 Tax=Cuscuta campestris TaxID=132261 RepID=A0A484LW71_9ASTE|nr:unnamed protein product [Cuscuta campestris]